MRGEEGAQVRRWASTRTANEVFDGGGRLEEATVAVGAMKSGAFLEKVHNSHQETKMFFNISTQNADTATFLTITIVNM
jgi:hypothetical protein